MQKEWFLKNEQATLDLGKQLSQRVPSVGMIYLHGELGAGKTTFVRGFLRGCGFTDKVKSPTYTLLEPYQIGDKYIYHVDLYRLKNPTELNDLGFRDYFDLGIFLVEWPEQGEGYLVPPDLTFIFAHQDEGRKVTGIASHEGGAAILNQF